MESYRGTMKDFLKKLSSESQKENVSKPVEFDRFRKEAGLNSFTNISEYKFDFKFKFVPEKGEFHLYEDIVLMKLSMSQN